MLWCPELAPTFVNGVDPETGIREVADDGRRPDGIRAGWIWVPWLVFYPPEKRAIAYAQMLKCRWTHAVIGVGESPVGDQGYHGLRPVTPEEAASLGARLTVVVDEMEAAGILPVWEGVAPDVKLAPGLDPAKCKVAVDDWDNSTGADCRIKALSETFPTALLVYELPGDRLFPTSDGCGPAVDPNAGGAWIREMQRLYPRFVAVMIENNVPDEGVDSVEARVRSLVPFWRDLLIVANGENDWYWAFWDNRPREQMIADNDELQRRLKGLVHVGYLSEETPHEPPPDEVITPIDLSAELDLHEATVYQLPADVADWPITTRLTRVELRDDDVYVDFDARDRWPEVSFGVQFSLGLALKIDGRWYASAPIELWKGKPGGGGDIRKPGQIPTQWYYDDRWGRMRGYQPQPGEQVGIFVVAGDLRSGILGPRERSNVVLVDLR